MNVFNLDIYLLDCISNMSINLYFIFVFVPLVDIKIFLFIYRSAIEIMSTRN